MTADLRCIVHNGVAFPRPTARRCRRRISAEVIDEVAAGARLAALFGRRLGDPATGCRRCWPGPRKATWRSLPPTSADRYPRADARSAPRPIWFEREIAEQWSVRPAGPPLAQADPLSAAVAADCARRLRPHDLRPGVTDFFQMAGDEVHEVAVGPVHAGSSSRGISASSATARRSTTWRFRWAISTAAWSGRCIGGPDQRALH